MDHELVNHSFSIIHRHPCIETQNLGKDQALATLAAVVALSSAPGGYQKQNLDVKKSL